MSLLHIDGSQGEGGGQIVRSALALSLVTGRPIVIERIRAGRAKPGLMRQHLTAVQAATAIGQADVRGAEIGSPRLEFTPRGIHPGSYQFSVGTAGSATLVLQTVLPALLIAECPSELILEGGTHNPWAPPFDFLEQAFLPLIRRMGPQVTVTLDNYGFYPAGGGRFAVQIDPQPRLAGFDLLERGPIQRRAVLGLVANLPRHIAAREVERILEKCSWEPAVGRVEAIRAHGPGNVVFAAMASKHVTEVFTGFGRTGASAEKVADEVVRQIRDYLGDDVPVGPYLADQLLLPLGISAWQSRGTSLPGGGSFRTGPLSRHATTHIDLLRQMLGVRIDVDTVEGRAACTVSVQAD
ncbi:MAG: RNA 3'-terminal phosphate cyclase [Pirellulaceae bacterium]|nr:RNA 3'-terminal phosphate cyclase [Pirellulaceae bacterium]